MSRAPGGGRRPPRMRGAPAPLPSALLCACVCVWWWCASSEAEAEAAATRSEKEAHLSHTHTHTEQYQSAIMNGFFPPSSEFRVPSSEFRVRGDLPRRRKEDKKKKGSGVAAGGFEPATPRPIAARAHLTSPEGAAGSSGVSRIINRKQRPHKNNHAARNGAKMRPEQPQRRGSRREPPSEAECAAQPAWPGSPRNGDHGRDS